jgi:hypothetical protein
MTLESFQTEMKPRELLHRLFLSTGDEELLAKASKESSEILAAMDQADWDEVLDEESASKLDLEWAGKVYEALAKSHVSKGDAALFEALFEGRAMDERKIGEAFECLMEKVSRPTRELSSYFGSLPDVSDSRREELLSSPAVQASSHALNLVRWGITPITIFTATEAVALLVDRKVRRGKLSAEIPVVISKRSPSSAPQNRSAQEIPFQTVKMEIRSATRCSEEASGRVLDWTIDAAQSVPFLYRGLRAQIHEKGISLISDKGSPEELLQRWTKAKSFFQIAASAVSYGLASFSR